ncbi:MAG: MFS transporter [Deltaproteobacteria bacterium]|nr:MFS transporter [Deltaproteobacteria bacterium]
MLENKYRWAQWGDLNAFFGLMLDNVTNLVILTGILVGVFGYPAAMVLKLMIPGTALGVLFGDAVYTWMAFRLAKKTGKTDVTAMPLGLDTPSTIGVAFAVLGPVYVETKDPMLTWQVGMATLLLIGVFKVVFSFFGDWVRRHVPQAGLLGSLAGIGIALLAFFPVMKIFSSPVVGLVSLGIILYAIIAGRRLPLGIPGAFFAVAAGCLIYYLMGSFDLLGAKAVAPKLEFHPAPPIPTLGFIDGLGKALNYLPIAFPFALLTIVGGINVTESARVAGDEYRTRDILLTEALATVVAALFGGVAQSTPYIGHPAYKAMGGRAAYTLATGLFIGIGGALGIMSFVVEAIPEAAITPILMFVGIEIVSQAFVESPRRHAPAVAFATVPVVGYLVLVHMDGLIGRLDPAWKLPVSIGAEHNTLRVVGHGFILTAMLWGGFLADLIDGKLRTAAAYLGVCAVFTVFGVIHSVTPSGDVYLAWRLGNDTVWQIALGYSLVACLTAAASFGGRTRDHEGSHR